MRNYYFWILFVSVFVGIFLLVRTARRNPEKLWVQILFGRMYGPRTDVKYMNRKDLFQSALTFFSWGVLFLCISFLIGFLVDRLADGGDLPAVAVIGLFATTIFSGMCILGALYLLVRGLLRRKDYVPPQYDVEEQCGD